MNKTSIIIAIILLVILALWLATGSINIVGGGSDNEANEPDQAEVVEDALNQENQDKNSGDEPFHVRTQLIKPEKHHKAQSIRGWTKADKKVQVTAEVTGEVLKRHVNKGDRVQKGDMLCTLDKGSRGVEFEGAKVMLESARSTYEASRRLKKQNFSSSNESRSREAAFRSAQADHKRAMLALEKSKIKSPVNGLVDAPLTEAGQFLSPGQVCATVVSMNPILIVSELTQNQVSDLKPGQKADVLLDGHEPLEGTISYIAADANPATRTFQVEISLPNPEMKIKSGQNAKVMIKLDQVEAHKIPQQALVLSDEGLMGVKILEDDFVRFKPVTIIETEANVQWVTGLEGNIEVIVLGQNFVNQGSKVSASRLSDGQKTGAQE